MIQVYTGNGKGKTTAALGLALRAAGHSMKTLIIQFMKSEDCGYGEHNSLKYLYPYIEFYAFGRTCFVSKYAPSEEDKKLAQRAFEFFKKSLDQKEHRIYILDEICVALDYELIDKGEFLKILDSIDREDVEIIMTGRYAPKELIDKADIVTEFKEIKHCFAEEGIMGRKGIDW